MSALEELAAWITKHEHKDKTYGWVYHYHFRSDPHSIALCTLVMEDLPRACPLPDQ